MKYSLILAVLLLVGCGTLSRHEQIQFDVNDQVHWVHQDPIWDDQKFHCEMTEGDCDDLALCAACKLLLRGQTPEEITMVFRKVENEPGRNHLMVENAGWCLMDNYSRWAYRGKCEDRKYIKGEKASLQRFPLRVYLKNNVKQEDIKCRGMNALYNLQGR